MIPTSVAQLQSAAPEHATPGMGWSSRGKPKPALVRFGQIVTTKMFKTVKSSARRRGSARKKHLHE